MVLRLENYSQTLRVLKRKTKLNKTRITHLSAMTRFNRSKETENVTYNTKKQRTKKKKMRGRGERNKRTGKKRGELLCD